MAERIDVPQLLRQSRLYDLADAMERWRTAHMAYHARTEPSNTLRIEALRARSAMLDLILGEVPE